MHLDDLVRDLQVMREKYGNVVVYIAGEPVKEPLAEYESMVKVSRPVFHLLRTHAFPEMVLLIQDRQVFGVSSEK